MLKRLPKTELRGAPGKDQQALKQCVLLENVSILRRLQILVLLVMLAAIALPAQQQSPVPEVPGTPEQPASPEAPPGSRDEAAQPTQQTSPTPPKPAPVAKITAEQLRELNGSVDDMLAFASQETGLAIRSKVKLQLRSRDDVHRFVEERMKDNKDTERLEQSEMVMKKLGLLPRAFNLKQFIVAAYSEQVAGYYDAKTKSMCLLDWIPFDEQRPVMAHELTHALQDQRVGLDKWLLADSAVSKKESEAQRDAALDELRLARDSVAEGQAMVVLWDYNLIPAGRNVENAGDEIRAFLATMMDAKDSPEMAKAPLYIKRGLIFPYREGFEFVRQVLIKRGKAGAFIGTLDNPPVSSRQLMEPETYLSGENVPQLKVPDFKKVLGAEWKPADFGAIGEIDVSVMLELYRNGRTSDELSPKWRGGYYYAARKGGPDSQLAFLYVSRWADEETARQFADIYAQSWKKRYQKVQAAENESVTSASTEEGNVSVARQGDLVVAVESFPDAETSRLRQAAFAANRAGAKAAVVPMRMRPALDLSAYFRFPVSGIGF